MTSASIYQSFYNYICEDRKKQIEHYKPGSGLHKHHIVPRHAGGGEEETNFTYLTIREHVIAHFLLWKIYRNVNDLRSMKMLGANLSVEKRRIVGKWCYENKIGIHGKTKEAVSDEVKKQRKKRIENGETNSFDYWASDEGRLKRASIGGKSAIQAHILKYGSDPFSAQTKEERMIYCSLGGKAAPKFPAHNKKEKKSKKFYSVEERERFILENDGWVIGYNQETKKILPKKKFTAYGEKPPDVKSFYTRDERDEFVSLTEGWTSKKKSRYSFS